MSQYVNQLLNRMRFLKKNQHIHVFLFCVNQHHKFNLKISTRLPPVIHMINLQRETIQRIPRKDSLTTATFITHQCILQVKNCLLGNSDNINILICCINRKCFGSLRFMFFWGTVYIHRNASMDVVASVFSDRSLCYCIQNDKSRLSDLSQVYDQNFFLIQNNVILFSHF